MWNSSLISGWLFSSTEAHSSNTVCSVTVSGEKMPAMTTEMQLQVSLHFLQSYSEVLKFSFQSGDKHTCTVVKKKKHKTTKNLISFVITGFTPGPLHIWFNRKCSSSSRRTHWSENKSCNGWK